MLKMMARLKHQQHSKSTLTVPPRVPGAVGCQVPKVPGAARRREVLEIALATQQVASDSPVSLAAALAILQAASEAAELALPPQRLQLGDEERVISWSRW